MKERQIKVVDRSVLQKEEAALSLEEKNEKEIVPGIRVSSQGEEKTGQPYSGKTKKRVRGKQILIGAVVLVLLLLTIFKIYVDNDYEPLHSMETYQAMTDHEIERSDNALAIQNEDAITQRKAIGFILYNDERVDRECYLPLMISLANRGYCVYLPTTFGNLPVLNQEAAEYAIRTYTTIGTWYIIAHGKACPVAARYVRSHSFKIAGMIYLGGASYRTDLSDLDLKILSITGTNDSILDMGKMQAAKANNPANTQYVSIDGGNHTGFLDTTLIRGDSVSSITSAEQIEQTVSAVEAFLKQQ